MNKAIGKKLCKALRSGKYKQGKGRLRPRKDCYCVMGVLCDVMGCKWEKEPGSPYIAVYRLKGSDSVYCVSTFVPDNLRREVGLKIMEARHLENMNDGRLGKHYSFAQLADYIEQNLLDPE